MSKYDTEYIRGINRYRIKEYLELLSSSYGKLEERKKKEKELGEKLERIKKFANEIHDKHELLDLVKELQSHLVQNLDKNDEILHASALKTLLGEIRKINQRLIEEEQRKEVDKLKKSFKKVKKSKKKSSKSRKEKVDSKSDEKNITKKVTKKKKAKKSVSKKKVTKKKKSKKSVSKEKSTKKKKVTNKKTELTKIPPTLNSQPIKETKSSSINLEESVVAGEYDEIRKRLNKLKKQLVD